MGDNIHYKDTLADDLAIAVSGGELSDIVLDSESQIMVIGVGGGGGNAVDHMQTMDIAGVNFVVCNTDRRALYNSAVRNKIQMGPGLGAGNIPAIGRKLAIESEEQLRTLLETSAPKMLFIAAGMGGGTGTGASPVIAKLAHDMGILTVAVVTMPLRVEGPSRYNNAVEGLKELNQWVDSLLVIDNERVNALYGDLPLKQAFGRADDVLGKATKGIAELITVEQAFIRVDFADVEKVMRKSGRAHMSVVKAEGENRALEVAEAALASSLLDDNHITGATEILISLSVRDIDQLAQNEITKVLEYIQKNASFTDEDGNLHEADIIWGVSEKPNLEDDEIEIVVVATRFADGNQLKVKTEYVSPQIEDPFEEEIRTVEVKPVEEVKPTPTRRIETHEPVTITPQQNRYKSISLQLREPAYLRRRSTFEDESEPVPPTPYHSVVREVQKEEPESSNGSLF
ncbi:MAG: cell division protein FtsZ [Alistipes sp.]|nr:cell division protein FtsZ [Alistipes sp.]